ncbi:relaxase family protein [Frankia nepalensis]|uniref:Uncharacterized protein n=1 Tax=Frankia nepalensis TaxID=1836974 RepID=A0A937UTQ1_9ACTN|nr:hypothetical protein [Frankia nepalensis]MBL7496186.1 hypothetical protein [Frankia nepalensis]MBL7511596.1 hypothetical protein [Frankia nepalensis]MBL7630271.1 hypothetical protein [Frankia nepalensis]
MPEIPGEGGGGWIGWITDAVEGIFDRIARKLVISLLEPLLDLLGRTLLTTPPPESLPAIGELWSNSWRLTVAFYGLLIAVGAVLVMAFGSVQTRTSIKEIGPRIPLAFLAAAFSRTFADTAINLVNSLPAAILGTGVNPDTSTETLRGLLITSLRTSPTLALALLGQFLALLTAALMCTYIARVLLTVVLIGAAPPLLAAHALPQTDGLARWWWRAFGACLAIQVAQAFVLNAALVVFFTPGGFTVLGPTPDGLVNMLAAITLMYVLFRIPFWLLQAAQVGGGPSFLGRVARAYVAGRVLGLLPSGRHTRGQRGASAGGAGGPGGRAGWSGQGAGRGPGGGHPSGPAPSWARRSQTGRDGSARGASDPLSRQTPRRPRPGPSSPGQQSGTTGNGATSGSRSRPSGWSRPTPPATVSWSPLAPTARTNPRHDLAQATYERYRRPAAPSASPREPRPRSGSQPALSWSPVTAPRRTPRPHGRSQPSF